MKEKKDLTFAEMYQKIVAAREDDRLDSTLAQLQYDPHHLECILRPALRGEASSCPGFSGHCQGKPFLDCLFDNIFLNTAGQYEFRPLTDRCRERISAEAITPILASRDLLAVLRDLQMAKTPVFAVVAPAFLSQFATIDDGQLRTAFKRLGFAGMVEVSLFADILTLKEALEFDLMIQDEADYMLTSCCCPVWIQMIRRLHPDLLKKVPGSVSPMVAAGRVVKHLVPGAITVFVGPCLAKKAEARENDIADAIDQVLTFKEVSDLFAAARIDAAEIAPDLREHSSFAGRIYAVSKGVSEAVCRHPRPDQAGQADRVKAVQADGVPECKRMLDDLEHGIIKANFWRAWAVREDASAVPERSSTWCRHRLGPRLCRAVALSDADRQSLRRRTAAPPRHEHDRSPARGSKNIHPPFNMKKSRPDGRLFSIIGSSPDDPEKQIGRSDGRKREGNPEFHEVPGLDDITFLPENADSGDVGRSADRR